VHYADAFEVDLTILCGSAKLCPQQVKSFGFALIHTVHKKDPAIISCIAAEPGELFKVFPEFCHRPNTWLHLDTRKIALHVARPVDEEIWLRMRVFACPKKRMPSLVNLTAKTEVEAIPLNPELVVKLIAIHALPIYGVLQLRDRQLKVEPSYAGGRSGDHSLENLKLLLHDRSDRNCLNVTLIKSFRASRVAYLMYEGGIALTLN
jgi:hypothetical protein